jgi:5-methylcytosine-specific restriction endonuclease McrA
MSRGQNVVEIDSLEFQIRAAQRRIKMVERSHKCYMRHRSERVAHVKAYNKAHPEVVRPVHARHRYKLLNVEGSYTRFEFEEKCRALGNRCVYCGRDNIKLEPDHVVPVSKGGTNYIDNVVPSCRSCNAQKKDRSVEDFKLCKPNNLV